MKRKGWPWLFGGAVVAFVLSRTGVLPNGVGDFAWGLAVGLVIGAVFSWVAERRV